MQPQTVSVILDAGVDAAYEKMTCERVLTKPDMRLLGFCDLQVLLEDEVRELREEIVRLTKTGLPLDSLSDDVLGFTLNAIRNEAADAIAFASGIVAKCDQKFASLESNKSFSLFDDIK